MDNRTVILHPGTVLYLGHNATTATCLEKFRYEGQNSANLGKFFQHFVGYFTTDETSAEGYARCLQAGRGWVNKYIVLNPVELVDVTEEMLHYEPDEVEKEFCNPHSGYFIQWTSTV